LTQGEPPQDPWEQCSGWPQEPWKVQWRETGSGSRCRGPDVVVSTRTLGYAREILTALGRAFSTSLGAFCWMLEGTDAELELVVEKDGGSEAYPWSRR
jgi:hypothetical protein